MGRFPMSVVVTNPRFFRSAARGLPAVAVAAAMASTAAAAPAPTQVTFTKDVAPILYRSCVRCHRPGDVAPMSLLSYSDARPWAASMKNRVSKREMPPWFLDKTIGIQSYKNDPSLSDSEVATIVKWVDTGAPQGNLADMPAAPAQEDVSAWRIGTPDLIVKYPTYKMPATGADLYGSIERSEEHTSEL